MFFQESMVMPSLYTVEDQMVIDRWIRTVPVYPERDDPKDANKIAEIALFSIRDRLPQGLSIKDNGGPTPGRKTWVNTVPIRNRLLFPVHLLDIERNDAHPGTVCHEAYYATFLPGYNIYVITVSQDTPGSHGCFDVAIDFFHTFNTVGETALNAGSIMKAWWQFQHKQLHKPFWTKTVTSGMIDDAAALLMRDAAWNSIETTDKVFC